MTESVLYRVAVTKYRRCCFLLPVTNWRSSVTTTLGIDVYRATSSFQDVIILHRTHQYIEKHEG